MAAAKPKRHVGKGNSPTGIAVFPYLLAPDDKPILGKPQTPRFKTGLRLFKDNPVHAAFLEKLAEYHNLACEAAIEELREKNKEAAANKRVDLKKVVRSDTYVKPDLDEEGNETGAVVVNFKLPAEYKDKKTGQMKPIKLPVFDARGQPFPVTVDVWGGSKIVVSFEARPYYTPASKSVGLTLRMNAVQIIAVVNGAAKDASAFGFEEQDGFDGSSVAPADDSGAPAPKADGEESEDF